MKITHIKEIPAVCALCGKTDILRPCGPNGESVCFNCAMKNKDATNAWHQKLLSENDIVIIEAE